MDSGDPMTNFNDLKQEYREVVSVELESYSKKKGKKSIEEFKRRVFGFLVTRTDLEFSPSLIEAIIKEIIWDEGYYSSVIDWRLEE